MAVTFKHAWMGVAIPCAIIGYVQLVLTILLISRDESSRLYYVVFHLCAFMLWYSYYLAIHTKPGSPPNGYKVTRERPHTFWFKRCLKCDADKPERAHHCRTCHQCVLKMDHHCPWTMNCVGYRNLPHFTRFLTWVLIGCGVALSILGGELLRYYRMRDLPSYLIDTREMAMVIVTFIVTAFVAFTVFLLFCRTIDGLMSNVTTIEEWEQDRMHRVFLRDAFWIKVRKNYAEIHPDKKFPELTSWKVLYRELPRDSVVPYNFSIDDLVFPYDLGSSYDNMVQALGPVYQWMWPWGGPSGDGMTFEKPWWKEADQLLLPFPIDGGDYNPTSLESEKESKEDFEETTYGNFPNALGETLDDFGVDLDTENYIDRKNE